DPILRSQCRTGTHSNGFLADVQMDEARQPTLGEEFLGTFFEAPDQQHATQRADQHVGLQAGLGKNVGVRGGHASPPGVSMYAITVPISTVSSSDTSTSDRTPLAGAWTSPLAFSVSTSATTSPS